MAEPVRVWFNTPEGHEDDERAIVLNDLGDVPPDTLAQLEAMGIAAEGPAEPIVMLTGTIRRTGESFTCLSLGCSHEKLADALEHAEAEVASSLSASGVEFEIVPRE